MKSKTVNFEGLGRCYYAHVGFRPPLKGEFYLSGAIVTGYRAPNDLSTAYHVVRPTHHAVASTWWQRGDPVKD